MEIKACHCLTMDADIESSNGRIIEVSSRNIDAYIFVVL